MIVVCGYEWRYLRNGKAKHALSYASARYAICGCGPQWFDPDDWLGTGSQVEYETVAALPECKRCLWVMSR